MNIWQRCHIGTKTLSYLWTLICIFLAVAISAMAAGFLFGIFVKFAKLAFFLTGA